jgi:hypothetical protein
MDDRLLDRLKMSHVVFHAPGVGPETIQGGFGVDLADNLPGLPAACLELLPDIGER